MNKHVYAAVQGSFGFDTERGVDRTSDYSAPGWLLYSINPKEARIGARIYVHHLITDLERFDTCSCSECLALKNFVLAQRVANELTK